MDILLIAAMAANRVIGRNGETPWHIPEELRFFKETTMGHPLIMGRKTFTSLPGPLPGRMNIILSRDPSFAPPGTVTAASLKEGLDLCRGRTMVFVIGGAQVFGRLCGWPAASSSRSSIGRSQAIPAFPRSAPTCSGKQPKRGTPALNPIPSSPIAVFPLIPAEEGLT